MGKEVHRCETYALSAVTSKIVNTDLPIFDNENDSDNDNDKFDGY